MRCKACGWGLGLLAAAALTAFTAVDSKADKKEEKMLAHMVYFALQEDSPEMRQAVVDSCHKYLSGHDGTVFYAAGVIGEEFDREVNARDYDVALTLVFTGKDAHDAYQVSQRHLDFIEENRPRFQTVKVYDSYVTKK